MKVVKKKYEKGGKLGKLAKAVKGGKKDKITQKAGKTAEGDDKMTLVRATKMPKTNQGAEGAARTEGIKEANAKLAEVKKQYLALTPEEKKGKTGDALRNQMRILRDSKRGAAAGTDGVARNKRGEYYNS